MSSPYGGSSATYELALNVDIAHVMLDAAELPALDGEAVDVRLIDEKTMERLNSDAQSMLMKATSVLLQNSPRPARTAGQRRYVLIFVPRAARFA